MASHDRFQFHLQCGKSLGLTEGKELQKYVENQMAEDRKAELEERRCEEARRENDEQRKENERQRVHEMRMTELKIQELQSRRTPTEAPSALPPTLPHWKDGNDMEAFLAMFDRIATDYEWDDRKKLHQLLPLLTGSAMEVYSNMNNSKEATYADLKKQLELSFEITLEQARDRLVNITLRPNETADGFANRVRLYYRKLHQKDGAPNTLEGFQDLIMRDTYISAFPAELRIQLSKLRGDERTLSHMQVEAQAWFDAHGHPGGKKHRNTFFPSRNPKTSQQGNQPQRRETEQPAALSQTQARESTSSYQNRQYNPLSKKRWNCLRCHTNAHYYDQCPAKGQPSSAAAAIVTDPRPQRTEENIGCPVAAPANSTSTTEFPEITSQYQQATLQAPLPAQHQPMDPYVFPQSQ